MIVAAGLSLNVSEKHDVLVRIVVRASRIPLSFPAEVSERNCGYCMCMCVCVAVIERVPNTGIDTLRKPIAVSADRAILFPRADVIYLDDRAIYPSRM